MSQRLAGCVYAMCLVDQRTEFLAKCVKRFLCINAFFSKPNVEALNMRLTTIIISPENRLWRSARWDHERPFSLCVILPEDGNDLGINLDFADRVLRLRMKKLSRLNSDYVFLEAE